jgi:hypothetical protein
VVGLAQATGNWRNLVGLAFSLIVSVLMLGSMSMVVRMPLDWGVFQREYSSGSNAVGPYVAARFLGVWPFLFAPMLMATVVYWMTGQSRPCCWLACLLAHDLTEVVPLTEL